MALAESLVRAHAVSAGVAYELIASRNELQALVASRRDGAAAPEVRVLRGWRHELVGAELLRLLDGHLSLSIANGQVRIADT